MAIDLDKLADELTAAGFKASKNKREGIYYIESTALRISAKGEVHMLDLEGEPMFLDDTDFTVLDIIRRHLAPVAPPAALRERVKQALSTMLGPDFGESSLVDITDAILAVFAAPEGVLKEIPVL